MTSKRSCGLICDQMTPGDMGSKSLSLADMRSKTLSVADMGWKPYDIKRGASMDWSESVREKPGRYLLEFGLSHVRANSLEGWGLWAWVTS
jgi:hypothetical protein